MNKNEEISCFLDCSQDKRLISPHDYSIGRKVINFLFFFDGLWLFDIKKLIKLPCHHRTPEPKIPGLKIPGRRHPVQRLQELRFPADSSGPEIPNLKVPRRGFRADDPGW